MKANGSNGLGAFLSRARVLIVDDEPASLTFMRHVLESDGYGEVNALADAASALQQFRELNPDVVVLDLWMPRSDIGFEFIAGVQALLPAGAYLPILVATADSSPEARRRALALGAREFLLKPVSPMEIRMRVRNLLETRFLHRKVQRLRKQLLRRGTRKPQRATGALGRLT
jgi:putative two-component system response regulator